MKVCVCVCVWVYVCGCMCVCVCLFVLKAEWHCSGDMCNMFVEGGSGTFVHAQLF